MHDGLESKTSFNKPEGIVTVNVCSQSGLLPTELCTRDPRGGTVVTEIFAKGTEPREYCDVHVEAIVDSVTGKIANEYCPIDNLQSKVFIQRMPPYIPSDNNGIVPADYGFTLPTSICTEHDVNTEYFDPEEDDDLDGEFPFNPDDELPLEPGNEEDPFPFDPVEDDDDDEDENNNNGN